ncbi:MAG: hypothetical protein WC795_00975 [Candidatus Paceibacterota bacterium]|jgi:hypothetical protein
MEKDISKSESIYKGHHVAGLENNNTLTMQANLFSSVLNKKSEKLVTALYMVTDCMDLHEPMKESIRSLGISLISEAYAFNTANLSDKEISTFELRNSIKEIMSLVEISSTVGMISSMNGSVLIKEFSALLAIVENIEHDIKKKKFSGEIFQDKRSNEIALPENFFAFEMENESVRLPDIPASYQGHKTFSGHIELPHVLKEKSKGQSFSNLKDKNIQLNTRLPKSDIALRLARRNAILRLVKDKKEVTIKEVSRIISECSEKTIQRELMFLVSEGVLKKEGDKRWSKYKLAQ